MWLGGWVGPERPGCWSKCVKCQNCRKCPGSGFLFSHGVKYFQPTPYLEGPRGTRGRGLGGARALHGALAHTTVGLACLRGAHQSDCQSFCEFCCLCVDCRSKDDALPLRLCAGFALNNGGASFSDSTSLFSAQKIDGLRWSLLRSRGFVRGDGWGAGPRGSAARLRWRQLPATSLQHRCTSGQVDLDGPVVPR